MQIIDTHSHIYLDDFKNDFDEVILRAKANNIVKVLLPNIDIDSVSQINALVLKDENFFIPMMGIHPTSVDADFKKNLEIIFEKQNLKNICAIGEIGLDYYWSKDFKQQQIEAFEYQINFAKERNLPIAIHCRDAFDDILDILEKNFDKKLKGVLHCFSGNAEQAKRLIAMGFYLGIGGVITYKNSGLDKVMENIDLKHLILETDSPYLTPVPFRGKRNESSYTIYIVQKLAEVKNISQETVCSITTENAKKLFNL